MESTKPGIFKRKVDRWKRLAAPKAFGFQTTTIVQSIYFCQPPPASWWTTRNVPFFLLCFTTVARIQRALSFSFVAIWDRAGSDKSELTLPYVLNHKLLHENAFSLHRVTVLDVQKTCAIRFKHGAKPLSLLFHYSLVTWSPAFGIRVAHDGKRLEELLRRERDKYGGGKVKPKKLSVMEKERSLIIIDWRS